MSVTTGINALFFPHIVDIILDFLCDDPFTAARLQVVCRAWHTKIKSRLFTHVWISYDCEDRDDWFRIGSTAGGMLRPSIKFSVHLPDPLEWDKVEWRVIGEHPTVVAALRNARVLDIHCMRIGHLVSLEPQWPRVQLDMIRFGELVDDVTSLPPSETVVSFKGPNAFRSFNQVLMDTTSKKVVIHPIYQDLALEDMDNSDLSDSIENVTVFYPFSEQIRGEEPAIGIADVANLIDLHFLDGNRTLTFVSDDVDHDLPKPVEASWAHLKSRLQDSYPHLLVNLEFLTATEYQERVGGETYRLHTCMDW